jgi:hypothetical protein
MRAAVSNAAARGGDVDRRGEVGELDAPGGDPRGCREGVERRWIQREGPGEQPIFAHPLGVRCVGEGAPERGADQGQEGEATGQRVRLGQDAGAHEAVQQRERVVGWYAEDVLCGGEGEPVGEERECAGEGALRRGDSAPRPTHQRVGPDGPIGRRLEGVEGRDERGEGQAAEARGEHLEGARDAADPRQHGADAVRRRLVRAQLCARRACPREEEGAAAPLCVGWLARGQGRNVQDARATIFGLRAAGREQEQLRRLP